MAKSKPANVYQLKITLANIKPPIWRRIAVKDRTLLELHDIIQVCMGWANYHMWAFSIAGEEYGDDRTVGGELDFQSARKARLSHFVEQGVKKFQYDYDFGDGWQHLIQVEKTLAADPKVKYPCCLKGARACPPEDCGGPWGYDDFLDAIQNPENENHEEMLEWIGGEFDPEKFDLDAINKQLASLR
jgi:hypothetical protein